MYLKLYSHLQALTKDEALQVVTSTYGKMKAIAELVPEDDNEFKTTIFKTDNRVDSPIARAILEATFNTANKVRTMTDKKEFHMACYKEAIWKLSILFFGDDPYGRNNSLGLKRLMSKLTPDPRMGMDKYKRRMAELNSYLPFTLCEAAYKKSNKEQPSMLREDELRDKLCDNLNIHQRMYCKQHNHNWFEESYARTIATLTLGEPQIIDAMDKSKENAKAAKASKLSGSKRKTDAANATGGNTNNKKRKYPHCQKYHKNECQLMGKPGDKTLQGNKQPADLNKLVPNPGSLAMGI